VTPSNDWMDNWIGRQENVDDILTLGPARSLAATLDLDPLTIEVGCLLPLPWHWIYALPVVRQSQMGPDGHPRRGGFLPPVPEPRRMWAGSRIRAHGQLRLGECVTRSSTIDSIREREGKSGRLVFVTVHHAWRRGHSDSPVVEEWQDIVFRGHPKPSDRKPVGEPAPLNPDWSQVIEADPVLLMRYSAVTFNSHRVHYDAPYATECEGYPGLIVHGPLIATLLLEAARRERPSALVCEFSFRAVAPIIAGTPFTVNGRDEGDGKLALWASDGSGKVAMLAEASVK